MSAHSLHSTPHKPFENLHATQVWVPWVSAVFGTLQYELLLGACLENMAERGSFAPRQPPRVPVGRRPPPAPPQPEVTCPPACRHWEPAGNARIAAGLLPHLLLNMRLLASRCAFIAVYTFAGAGSGQVDTAGVGGGGERACHPRGRRGRA